MSHALCLASPSHEVIFVQWLTFVSCTFLHRSLILFQVSIPKMLLSLSLNPFFTLPIAASFQLTVECHPTHPLIVPVLQPWVDVCWCLLSLCCVFPFSYFFVFPFNMWTPCFFKNTNLGCLLCLAVLCLKCFMSTSHLPRRRWRALKWRRSTKLILEDVKASFCSGSIWGITYVRSCNKLHLIALCITSKSCNKLLPLAAHYVN